MDERINIELFRALFSGLGLGTAHHRMHLNKTTNPTIRITVIIITAPTTDGFSIDTSGGQLLIVIFSVGFFMLYFLFFTLYICTLLSSDAGKLIARAEKTTRFSVHFFRAIDSSPLKCFFFCIRFFVNTCSNFHSTKFISKSGQHNGILRIYVPNWDRYFSN